MKRMKLAFLSILLLPSLASAAAMYQSGQGPTDLINKGNPYYNNPYDTNSKGYPYNPYNNPYNQTDSKYNSVDNTYQIQPFDPNSPGLGSQQLKSSTYYSQQVTDQNKVYNPNAKAEGSLTQSITPKSVNNPYSPYGNQFNVSNPLNPYNQYNALYPYNEYRSPYSTNSVYNSPPPTPFSGSPPYPPNSQVQGEYAK
ncbi:MAG: hypothetical protein AB7F64_08390 [Gammaproteobacteria bacterium]